jgi:peptide methionine sulfoxide reductase MsrB
MRQCPHQLFWDNEQQKCEWSDKVRCSGRTLVALSLEANAFCTEKPEGFYIDPNCKFDLFVTNNKFDFS